MEFAKFHLGDRCPWEHRVDHPLSAHLRHPCGYVDDRRSHRNRGVRPIWPATTDRRPCRQRLVVFPIGHLDTTLWRGLLGAAAHWRKPMRQAVLGTGLVLAPVAWFASLEA